MSCKSFAYIRFFFDYAYYNEYLNLYLNNKMMFSDQKLNRCTVIFNVSNAIIYEPKVLIVYVNELRSLIIFV